MKPSTVIFVLWVFVYQPLWLMFPFDWALNQMITTQKFWFVLPATWGMFAPVFLGVWVGTKWS